jgi:cytochrome c5
MSSDRERRFLNLEKPRPVGPADEPPDPSARFGRVEAPGRPPADAPLPDGATDRFRAPKERPLDVAPLRDGEQPFARCASCEMDNSVYAATCQNCGADLTSREQRLFNERLWAKRREEAEEEAAQHAARERERGRVEAAEVQARRQLAESMAREEARRVDERLGDATWGQGGWGRRGWGDPEGDGWGAGGGGWGGGTAVGLRLLRMIRNPLLRVAVIVAAIALPLLLIVLPDRRNPWRAAGMLVAFLILALVSPPGWRYRRRRWWGW